ncbi:MAG: hypothetical protein R8M37_02055 [Alphaproteobacteria bacterium]|nr:hypothetical protein [Alphaproteobacteria bacterium]
MISRSTEFYHSAIKNAYPDATCIRCPDVPGMIAPIFFADVLKKTIVCRFSLPEIVFKNKIASDLLCDYGVPVPQTKVHAYVGTWFESYEYCKDKTLYEHIKLGLPDDKIFKAYVGAFEIQNKISKISANEFCPEKFREHVDMLCATTKIRGRLSKIYNDILFNASVRSPLRLLHNDIHSKNILYSPETDRIHLIDLDAVSLCNENFTMMTTVQRYPLKNARQLMSVYQDITGRKLDVNKILFACNAMQLLHNLRHPFGIRQK